MAVPPQQAYFWGLDQSADLFSTSLQVAFHRCEGSYKVYAILLLFLTRNRLNMVEQT